MVAVWFFKVDDLLCLKLTPIISDPEYLLDQHILICIKSTDCDESYGKQDFFKQDFKVAQLCTALQTLMSLWCRDSRRGLRGTESCRVLVYGVPDHTDSPRRADGVPDGGDPAADF